MATIKITAKRQATLPRELCRELNLDPGDAVNVEKRTVGGVAVWCLIPPRKKRLACFGALRKAARGKRHDLQSMRKAIAKGWAEETGA
jgi:bifunctional DNA-binding transcriptional regulator/antitoxin component of YhaV-PrlF toxin-antitoxin module